MNKTTGLYNTFTKNDNIVQHLTTLHKILQNLTIVSKPFIFQAFTKISSQYFTCMTKIHNPKQLNKLFFSKIYRNFTTLCITLHNFTKLYNSFTKLVHNFTQCYKTLQILTTMYKLVQQLSQLYRIFPQDVQIFWNTFTTICNTIPNLRNSTIF